MKKSLEKFSQKIYGLCGLKHHKGEIRDHVTRRDGQRTREDSATQLMEARRLSFAIWVSISKHEKSTMIKIKLEIKHYCTTALRNWSWLGFQPSGRNKSSGPDGWRLKNLLFLLSQVRLGHCDYFIVQYEQRHVSTNSGLYQALIWLKIGCAFLPGRFHTKMKYQTS